MTKLCHGFLLDKMKTNSLWSQRPLTDAQRLYAARDAFVLVKIYEAIAVEFQNRKTEFDSIVNAVENKDLGRKRKAKTPGTTNFNDSQWVFSSDLKDEDY